MSKLIIMRKLKEKIVLVVLVNIIITSCSKYLINCEEYQKLNQEGHEILEKISYYIIQPIPLKLDLKYKGKTVVGIGDKEYLFDCIELRLKVTAFEFIEYRKNFLYWKNNVTAEILYYEDSKNEIIEFLLDMLYEHAKQGRRNADKGIVILDTINHEYYLYFDIRSISLSKIFKTECLINSRLSDLIWINNNVIIICIKNSGYYPQIVYRFKEGDEVFIIPTYHGCYISNYLLNLEKFVLLYENDYFKRNKE